MSEVNKELLFLRDPQKFLEIVWLEDPSERVAALQPHVEDIILCEIMRFGAMNRSDMVQPLQELYRIRCMALPPDRRRAIYLYIKGLVENVDWVSTSAFMPFIAEEDAIGIVSSATIDFVSLSPLQDGDPMTSPNVIISLIGQGIIRNAGAAFGGLLCLGDSRVNHLLLPLRDSLDRNQVSAAVNCNTGIVSAATVEFYLDWLEGIEGDPNNPDDLFGTVAAGLGGIRRYSKDDFVQKGHRPIPSRGVPPEVWQKAIALVPVDEYVKSIAPRLYALERCEPPPRVMPHVLAAWGLEPVTPAPETADLGDRSGVSPGSEASLRQAPEIETIKEEWWDGTYRIHLLWGTLNPDGPTLCCLGSKFNGLMHRTFFRRLHFLGGATSFTPATEEQISPETLYWDLVALHNGRLQRHESGVIDVIPSFLIADDGDLGLVEVARKALSDGGVGRADWGQEMAYRRHFGDNFFARAGAEIRAYYDEKVAESAQKGEPENDELVWLRVRYGRIPAFADATKPTWTSSPCTPELLEEWLEGIGKPEHAGVALITLKEMWEGSSSLVPEEMKERGIPWGRISDFIAEGGFRFPERS